MTTEIQIEGLALRLKTDDALSLVVKDQPVVAVFEDSTTKEKDSLGQVSVRNSCSDILRLWIGFDQKTSKLFIALAIWIGAKRSRKKNNKTGRLMFLVVPAETLTLKSACGDYDKFAKQLPNIVSDKPADDRSGKCKLLRMSFQIDSPSSYVIMPQYKRQANATNPQMKLLRKLKSLSESTRFELFTNYDEATSSAIQNLCKIQAGMAVTPSVILEKLYSNKQSGCIDMWVELGWREQDLVKKCAVAACKDAGPVNESHDVLGPPQYEPQAPSFRKPLSPQSRHQAPLQAGLAWTGDHPLRTSPDLPSTAPPYSTHAELNSPLHDITYQHASVASPDENQEARVRQAEGLLATSVEPDIRSIIADIADPHKAFLEIKSICQITNTRALGIALAKIGEVEFDKKDTVISFLSNILLLQSDINDLSGSYSDDQVIAKVLRSLPSTFLPFIIRWNMLAGTPSLPNTVKQLYSQLICAEARFPQMATHFRNKHRQSGRNDEPANRLLPCRNKMGTHAEDKCWTKHPELRKTNTNKPRRL
jgi:hypothetical protein